MTILSENKYVCVNYEVWSNKNFIVSKGLYLKIAKKRSLWIDKKGRDHTTQLQEGEVDCVDGYIDSCDDDMDDSDDGDDYDGDDDDDDEDEDHGDEDENDDDDDHENNDDDDDQDNDDEGLSP